MDIININLHNLFKMALQIRYFLAGVGVASMMHYPKLRAYQARLETDVNALLKEHKMLAMQVVEKQGKIVRK